MNIQERPDFETTIKDNLLELLRVVETVMHTPEKAKYPCLTVAKVLASFLQCRQGKKETLLDYLGRFKSERDIVYRICGKGILDGFYELNTEYRALGPDDLKKQFKKDELNKFIAALFLRDADYARYNYLLVEYRKSFANK